MRIIGGVIIVLSISVALGCARPQAKTHPDQPPLDPPPPPARVVPPPEEPAPAPATPRTGESQAPRRPVRQPARTEPERPPQPPTPRETPAKPAEPETPPTQPPPAPAPTLQTTPPADQGEIERRVRGLLSQAARDLGRVDYRALNADGRGQYDTAKRFIEQSDKALKDKNFPFALKLAENAATIAQALAGR